MIPILSALEPYVRKEILYLSFGASTASPKNLLGSHYQYFRPFLEELDNSTIPSDRVIQGWNILHPNPLARPPIPSNTWGFKNSLFNQLTEIALTSSGDIRQQFINNTLPISIYSYKRLYGLARTGEIVANILVEFAWQNKMAPIKDQLLIDEIEAKINTWFIQHGIRLDYTTYTHNFFSFVLNSDHNTPNRKKLLPLLNVRFRYWFCTFLKLLRNIVYHHPNEESYDTMVEIASKLPSNWQEWVIILNDISSLSELQYFV